MKHACTGLADVQSPFVNRMVTIIFEPNIPHKGTVKPKAKIKDQPTINITNFHLSAGDLEVYTRLFKGFFRIGFPMVTKTEADIAKIVPPAVFMEALPRLEKAKAVSATFWEHCASAPDLWREVKSF